DRRARENRKEHADDHSGQQPACGRYAQHDRPDFRTAVPIQCCRFTQPDRWPRRSSQESANEEEEEEEEEEEQKAIIGKTYVGGYPNPPTSSSASEKFLQNLRASARKHARADLHPMIERRMV